VNRIEAEHYLTSVIRFIAEGGQLHQDELRDNLIQVRGVLQECNHATTHCTKGVPAKLKVMAKFIEDYYDKE